jgi:mannosyl-oligosaccharide alpha-1,2-mannosidase
MEFTRLSQLTGDARFFDAIQRVSYRLAEQQPNTHLPGMWPQRYEVRNTDFTQGRSFSLGAEADSGYEYLLKMTLLLGGDDNYSAEYARMFTNAMDTAENHLFFRPMNPNDLDILLSGKAIARNGYSSLIPESEHLTCFLGGTLAMGGKLLGKNNYLDNGEKLTNGCAWAYRASPSGIVPENYQTIPCPTKSMCAWNETLWEELTGGRLPKGFVAARDRQYHLRPEAIESVFYLYRITGDTKYQDIAWKMFQSIDGQTWTEFGNTALSDVFVNPAPQSDSMESFWFAETLKYLYLIFSPPDLISLDDYVFNTEAHPFRIPKR